jgi:hypothetical protein
LNSPCYKTPKNAIIVFEQREKKNGGKNSHIFCNEPRWIKKKVSVFELPVLRNFQKGDKKKTKKKTHKNRGTYVLFSASWQMYVVFFSPLPPLEKRLRHGKAVP